MYNYVKTHSLRSTGAALLMEEDIDYYLYASAYPYQDIKIAAGKAIAVMDPILLPMVSSASTTIISAGAGLSRLEKTKVVSTISGAYSYLDVCVAPARKRMQDAFHNCSQCWKCDRTMLTLDVLGTLDKFHEAFDLKLYRRDKKKKIRMTLLCAYEGDALDRELVEAALSAGWKLPQKWSVILRKKVGMKVRKFKKFFVL